MGAHELRVLFAGGMKELFPQRAILFKRRSRRKGGSAFYAAAEKMQPPAVMKAL